MHTRRHTHEPHTHTHSHTHTHTHTHLEMAVRVRGRDVGGALIEQQRAFALLAKALGQALFVQFHLIKLKKI